MNSEPRALIFDIQGFSVHDGPGCRTTVFLAGCPLSCKWCANPEHYIAQPHLMFSERVCKWSSGCRACVGRCPKEGLVFTDKGPSVRWDICRQCQTHECTAVCASQALRVCGRYYSVSELMDILKRDFNNWGSEGGVTFSGGEPFGQSEFLYEMLKCCRRTQIHTAVETSAYVPQEIFLRLMENVDFAFIDLKHMDESRHREGTGVSNQLILHNIEALSRSSWKGRTVLRTPVIGGFNDSDENAGMTIDFMKRHGLFEINLLRFHRLGLTKWEQLGKNYPYASGGEVTDEKMYRLQQLYLDEGILCYLGETTPF